MGPESASEPSEGADTATLAGRTAFSSHGKPWMIVLKPTPRGKAVDRLICRLTGHSFITFEFAKAAGQPYMRNNLLLTTIGSKTGALRTSCLPYFVYGDDLVVCGTKGGGPSNPFWVGNLEADPQCWIRIKRRQVPARARVAVGAERDAVFAEIATQHHGLERYQVQTRTHGRDVAMVMITPRQPVPLGERRG
jgi:deazaflavin-dependent oxidoreductase (nitroreductase family)